MPRALSISTPAVSSSSPEACSCVASSVSFDSRNLHTALILCTALTPHRTAGSNCCTAARALNRMTLCSTSRSSSHDSLCSSHSSIIARLSVLLAILVARLSVLHQLHALPMHRSLFAHAKLARLFVLLLAFLIARRRLYYLCAQLLALPIARLSSDDD